MRIPRNLALRLATAAVGVPLLLLVIWAGGWPFAIVAGLITLGGTIEFAHAWLMPTRPYREVAQLGPFLLGPAIVVAGVHADERFLIAGALLAALFLGTGYSRTNAFGPRKPLRVMGWAIIYPGIIFSTIVLARDLDQGRDWVLLTVLTTFTIDTGAYFTGSLLGRHKLWPAISPRKTWEGAVGGVCGGVLAVGVLSPWMDLGLAVGAIVGLGVGLGVAAQAGDLLESWMKRKADIKDSSGLLPGHGGLLDRLDSVVFVAPVVFLVANFT
ncbi:MAG: phosphatidate cytidylyltransferase [Chloroflexi bacterium]|nr:phosphatidate cytidylyltransferase [Chloroflexota bacterium]